MALDVLSLSSGRSGRVHNSGHGDASDHQSSRSATRRNVMKKKSRDDQSTSMSVSMRSVSISMRSLTEKEQKRRKKKEHKRFLEKQEALKKKKEKKTKENNRTRDDLGDRTEHTSNITEHSRTIMRRCSLDNGAICNMNHNEIYKNNLKNDSDHSSYGSDSDNKDGGTVGGETYTCGQSVETRESRFQSLLSQWKTRESEQIKKKEETKDTEIVDDRSKASYLSEDEDHSCFEGVMKHWRKKDTNPVINVNDLQNIKDENKKGEVVVDDDPSEVSSLGESLRWGYDSDSRFDFGFDARFDAVLKSRPQPPRSKKQLKEEKKKTKKAKKKKEKEEAKKKKKSEKKIKKSPSDDSESVMDISESQHDASSVACDEVSVAQSVAQSVLTMDDTVYTLDTTGASVATESTKKKKKKKDKSKSKKDKSKSKKDKSKSKKSKKILDSSFATLDTTGVKALDSTESTSEQSPLSDGENSKSFLPNCYQSPAFSPKKPVSAKSTGPSAPLSAKDLMPKIPNLLESPSSEALCSGSEHSSSGMPYLPNMLASPTTPRVSSPKMVIEKKRPDP